MLILTIPEGMLEQHPVNYVIVNLAHGPLKETLKKGRY